MPTPEEIRAGRERAGLTQVEAAELLGVTRLSWVRYETGDREMTDAAWTYWKHVAGIERIPFKGRKPAG